MTVSFLLIAVFVALGGFVQGTVGFAFGMVVMSLFPLVIAAQVAVPLAVTCALPIVLMLLWLHRKSVRLADVWPLWIGTVAGIPVGAYLLQSLPADLMGRLIGGLIVLTAIYMLVQRTVAGRRIHLAWKCLAGVAAGALSAAFAVGGPPVIFCMLAHGWSKDRFKGNFQLYVVGSNMVLLPYYRFGPTGGAPLLTNEILHAAACLMPVALVATLLGSLLYRRISQSLFRRLVLGTLALLGALLIAR